MGSIRLKTDYAAELDDVCSVAWFGSETAFWKL